MLARIEAFLAKRFCSRPGPIAYIVALLSLATGFFFAFFSSLPDIKNTFIYQDNILAAPNLWGALLLVGSILLIVGFKAGHKTWVRLGAMINFIMWLFAAILYAQHGLWFAFSTVSVFHLSVQANFYLSASLDTLWDKE